MREILFRGKRLDNNEWVYGHFLADNASCTLKDSGLCVCPHDGSDAYIFEWRDEDHEYEGVGVDPATVGQYTGLRDKNGMRIFEGDIVHCIARMDKANCVVIFEEGEFRLVPERRYKSYVTGGGFHALRCFVKEVIGNIHDNPELLEGAVE